MREAEALRGIVVVKRVSDVSGTLVMEDFMRKEKDLLYLIRFVMDQDASGEGQGRCGQGSKGRRGGQQQSSN